MSQYKSVPQADWLSRQRFNAKRGSFASEGVSISATVEIQKPPSPPAFFLRDLHGFFDRNSGAAQSARTTQILGIEISGKKLSLRFCRIAISVNDLAQKLSSIQRLSPKSVLMSSASENL